VVGGDGGGDADLVLRWMDAKKDGKENVDGDEADDGVSGRWVHYEGREGKGREAGEAWCSDQPGFSLVSEFKED
jgi:hypothetical protein